MSQVTNLVEMRVVRAGLMHVK